MLDANSPLIWDLVETQALCPSDHPQDLAQAQAFAFDDLRSRFLRRRSAVRGRLEAWLGRDIAQQNFDFGPDGKPFLAGGPAVSVSHDDTVTAVAIARTGEVGIDIQTMTDRRTMHFNRVLGTECCTADAGRLWTQMEAIGKWNGRGLQLGLRRLYDQAERGPTACLDGKAYSLSSQNQGARFLSICASDAAFDGDAAVKAAEWEMSA